MDNRNDKELSCGCCDTCRHKHTPRDDKEIKQLKNRLSRVSGQINGIIKMLDDNRYCGDILIQVAAVESAMQSFGYLILQEHMKTCMTEEVQSGNTEVVDEVLELMKKLKIERQISMKKLKFSVTGMSCAACQAHVEKAVSKVEGVADVNVNLLANKMTVDFDESVTNAQAVIKAVEGAGYGASEIGDNENKTASPVAAAQDESKR